MMRPIGGAPSGSRRSQNTVTTAKDLDVFFPESPDHSASGSAERVDLPAAVHHRHSTIHISDKKAQLGGVGEVV